MRPAIPARILRWLALGAAALTLAAPQAAAAWLVTRDGARLETRGPWEVKAGRVVFTLANGTLSSLALAEVDLDASEAATDAAEAAASAPAQKPVPPPPKKAVLVLTDADVGHARRPARAPGEEGASGSEADRTAAGREEGLVVVDWQAVDETFADGLVITGQLHNRSADVQGNIRLTVRVYDGDGVLLQSAQADLSASTLQPGDRASFTATLSGVFVFAGARFETDSLPVSTRKDSAPARVRPQDESALNRS